MYIELIRYCKDLNDCENHYRALLLKRAINNVEQQIDHMET